MRDFIRHLIEADHPVITTAKGAIGVGATSTGFYVSVMPEIEAWLRVVSLLIGITVGLLTMLSLLHAITRRPKQNPKTSFPRETRQTREKIEPLIDADGR